MTNNLLDIIQKEHIAELTKNKTIPNFKIGDTVRVKAEFSDGVTVRFQNYEGVVIARKRCGVASNVTIRKVTGKFATERVFPIYSPTVGDMTIVKYGKARRAKLYYLRDSFGKAARIKEDATRKMRNKDVPK